MGARARRDARRLVRSPALRDRGCQELEDRNRNGTLPAVRAATGYAPALPGVLEPGASWKGEISARGSLVAGSWARVVFGTLVAVGKPPEGLEEMLIWITDESYELEA